eukprot:TRINITY_DN13389_c0_g1_i1.p1 TRINITY_DN13389_c0_g1~~TRINITY_DN13389_c0_g1_i1.p1  ORF type:complete len:259 (-),score=50.81 TRINITY_DN13389_c0_g1_i1:42-818(-)
MMDYVTISSLGVGAVGTVDLIRMKSTGLQYALKTVSKRSRNYRADQVEKEIKAGKMIQHENVGGAQSTWEDENNIYLLMEYIGGWDLFSLLDSLNGPMTERMCRSIFRQVVEATVFLHHRGIAHRDIKLDNIMVDLKFKTKLIDFGLCETVEASQCVDHVGSAEYCAPEISGRGPKYNGFQADVWSLGIVLFAMLHSCFPYTKVQLNRMKMGCSIPVPFGTSAISSSVKDLIRSMLQTDPKKRPTIEQISQHEWIQIP